MEDLDRMRATLDAAQTIRDAGTRRETIAALSTAALIDIAASLRVLAAEAAAAMPEPEPEPEPAEFVETEIPAADVFVGARAWADGSAGIVREIGESEGRAWVRVSWFDRDDDADEAPDSLAPVSEKTWADALTYDAAPWSNGFALFFAALAEQDPGDGSVDLDEIDDDFTPPPAAPEKKKGKGKK